MRIKMGTVVPKMGTTVHLAADQTIYRKAIADALRRELGPTHQAIKTAMRWTGASERTAKYWLSGERGPSGEHLILLAQHSDAVFHFPASCRSCNVSALVRSTQSPCTSSTSSFSVTSFSLILVTTPKSCPM